MPETRISNRLKTLHSVLSIPTDVTSNAPIRVLHLSFANFLLDPDREHDFWIEEKTMHLRLAQRCLEVLCTPGTLRQDICDLRHPGYLREDIKPSHIQATIPLEVQYACKYWVHHAQKSGAQAPDLAHRIHAFLSQHLLHWSEAMSILGKTSELLHLVGILSDLFNQDSTLVALIYDIRRFLSTYIHIINIAPLQIYISCVMFAPKRSLVKDNLHGLKRCQRY